MAPIDPTPYVIPYAIVVFLCPWIVYASIIVRHCWLLKKNNISSNFLFEKSDDRAKRIEFLRTNQESLNLRRKAVRWMVIVLLCWIIGFAFLAGTLLVLGINDMLI